MNELRYQTGFGNFFETEADPGTLPKGRNNPQRVARGLYAEQLSGDAFTALSHENHRSWLYRIAPSVVQSPFEEVDARHIVSSPTADVKVSPDALRWDPLPYPSKPSTFIESFVTFCLNGDVTARDGSAVHLFACTKRMEDEAFYDADGDLLVVLQEGDLFFRTEFGLMAASPGEIVIIPRGIKFSVDPASSSGKARGYVCENYGDHFRLPYRGVIGANGLANERDFAYPVAAYEDVKRKYSLYAKFGGKLFRNELPHSPFDVVAWHGNYAPYKYDLAKFNTMNTVSFDHPDPSIFTVLTSASARPGVANVDFVIFPPRWMVAEDTFRPPYYHRNVMSEYMGLVHGVYDAKPAAEGGGFNPGGGSLHNCMSPHGPDAKAFAQGSEKVLAPEYQGNTLAFMFESGRVYLPTTYAMTSPLLQKDYQSCWLDLPRTFKK